MRGAGAGSSPAAGIPRVQQAIAILWPGFLVAAVATVLLFAAVDPRELSACMGWGEVSRLGAYSGGFLILWLLASGSSLLTCYFQKPCEAGAEGREA
jgi:hypothetical protein